MSKLDYLTIVIVAICLAAVVFIMIRVADLGKTKNPLDAAPPQEQHQEDATPDPSETYSPDPAAPSDDSSPRRSDNPAIDWDTDDNEVADLVEEKIPEDQYREPSNIPAATSSSGDFMVLAGSFRLRSGAEAEVQRLKRLGYENAEVTLFNNGAFAAVLVDRFTDLNKAETLVNELQTQHSVPAYVHEKRGGN